MGIPATPPESERTATLGLSRDVVRAVENDEEGPFALPDFETARSWNSKVDLLKNWWSDVDQKIFRICQDLLDTRAALEVACALLASSPAGTDMSKRLRLLDIPSQEEIDTFVAGRNPTEAPPAPSSQPPVATP